MQPTNNNPLTEIGAIVLSALLIAGGVLLLVLKDVDTAYATSIFILAGAIFAGNLALKAPSPTQQAALLQLTAQALQTQQAQPQLAQAPAPVAAPQVVQFNPAMPGTTIPPNFTTSYNPPTSAISLTPEATMPSAMLTTQNMPTVQPPQ